MQQVRKESPILIIGAGCFGLATAHSLASAGYTNVTVLDKDSRVPSRFSAANDLNKVIRAEYIDPFYTDLSLRAIRQWQTNPLYQPYYFQTGFLNVTSAAAKRLPRTTVEKYYSSLKGNRAFAGKVYRVNDAEDVKRIVPSFKGPVSGWSGYFNTLAGYAHSADALRAVYEACVKLGVRFQLDQAKGEVESLLYDPALPGMVCTGAQTLGKHVYRAEVTIVAAGANAVSLVPKVDKQVTGRCWGVVHIQLTPEEAAELKGIPVTNVRDLAFFFEPDRKTHKLKFCHMGGGFTNASQSKAGISLPFSKLADSEFIPPSDEEYIRKLLGEVLPQFADRPFIDAHLCWFSDHPTSDFIIDFVPETKSSLAILSGDSGHGFKMLPIFGDFAKSLLEKGQQSTARWQWKSISPAIPVGDMAWRSDSAAQELASIPRAKL